MRDLLDQLSESKGAKFASFKYRTKGTNELSQYLVILGADVTNVYQKDVETLEAMIPTLSGIDKEAAEAILASLRVSLDGGVGNNPNYTHGKANGDTYITTEIPSVKVNKNDNALHLMNVLLQRKTVIEAGVYKAVKSSDLTIAKRKIEKMLRKGDIRQFALSGVQIAKLNGETIEIE